MLKEIFGQQDKIMIQPEEQYEEVREENELPEAEYEEYEEEIEVKAKDLAKYVQNSEHLMKMKKETD